MNNRRRRSKRTLILVTAFLTFFLFAYKYDKLNVDADSLTPSVAVIEAKVETETLEDDEITEIEIKLEEIEEIDETEKVEVIEKIDETEEINEVEEIEEIEEIVETQGIEEVEEVEVEETEFDSEIIITEMSATMWTTGSINVRRGPGTDYEKVGYYLRGTEITVTGLSNSGWYRVTYNGEDAYVFSEYVTNTEIKSYNGICVGDVISGEATYYCSCELCCDKSDGITASGIEAYDGIIACNWLPLGTEVLIDGVSYVVEDRGGSNFDTVGRVDIYTSDGHQTAVDKGRDSITITIVSLP